MKWHTELKKVSELKGYDKNPRKIERDNYDSLMSSIDDLGNFEPLVIDIDGTVIAGNQRLKVAIDLKEEEVEVSVPERKLTEDEIKRIAILSNMHKGEWDTDLLQDEFEDTLKELDMTDLLPDKVVEVEEDNYEEPEELPIRVHTGEIWQLGNHRLMCGDSTKIEDVEKLMNGQKADMVFTDPPYGIDYSDMKHKFRKIENDDSNPEQLITDSLCLFSNVPIYVCCNWQSMGNVGTAMENANFDVKSCIVWDKGTRIQNLDKFYKRHEFILYSGKFGGQKTVDGDVWQIARETRDDHPTAKPIELCARAIGYSSKKNGLVVDVFGGSGSTLIACEQTNRICYMMELDEHYCTVILDRWEKLTGKKAELISTETPQNV